MFKNILLKVPTFMALRDCNFRNYFFMQLVCASGTFLQGTVLGWVVFDITHDAKTMGLVTSIGFVPMIVLGIFAGAIADRYDRRKLLVVTQVVAMILAGILALLYQMHYLGIISIVIFSILNGVVGSFDNPTRATFTTTLARKEDLSSAVGLNSSMMTLAQVIGPALAGFLYALISPTWVFMVNALSFIPVIIVLVWMELEPHQKNESSVELQDEDSKKIHKSIWEMTKDGFVWIVNRKDFMCLFVLCVLIGFFVRSYGTILPVTNANLFHDDKHVLGQLTAAMGVGALVAALFIPVMLGNFIGRVVIVFGAIISTISLLGLGWCTSFPAVMVLLFLNGFGYIFMISSTSALLQGEISSDLRTRVVSILYSAAMLGMMGGSYTIGLVTNYYGPARVSYGYGAIMLLVTIGIGVFLYYHKLFDYKVTKKKPAVA